MTSKVRSLSPAQKEDGDYHIVDKLLSDEEAREQAYRSAVYLAVRDAVRGDPKPLIRILLTNRPLNGQELGCIQDYLDGKLKRFRHKTGDPIVVEAAKEFRRRRRAHPTASVAAVLSSVAEDFGVEEDMLSYLLARSKNRSRKKPQPSS